MAKWRNLSHKPRGIRPDPFKAHWAEMLECLEARPDQTALELLLEFRARYPERYTYREAVERKLEVFTSRENVALSRDASRSVLADGNLVLRPDVANARVEATLTISREEFLQQKQIDQLQYIQPCRCPRG
jgi:hypothetical protein